jgi:polyphenol oxidase
MEGVSLFCSELLRSEGFGHGFTKRTGGVSAGPFASLNLAFDVGDDEDRVRENSARLRAAVGGSAPLLRVRQVHGNAVVDAAAILEATAEADAIVACGIDALLAVQTADCAAVLLADPATRAVAAVHAGWRGASNGVIRNAVRALRERGAEPQRLIAAIGPCIGKECYEVREDVARRFPESVDPVRGEDGMFRLDLGYAVEVSLIGAGLTSRNIDRIHACTRCAPDALFSYRGSGGRCGRNMGFIAAAPLTLRGAPGLSRPPTF